MRIDMHNHTTLSDGTHTPEEVARAVIDRGISLHVATEHDRVNRDVTKWIEEYQLQNKILRDDPLYIHSFEGVEISTRREDGGNASLHILHYAQDISTSVELLLEKTLVGKIEKVQKQCETLHNLGCRVHIGEEAKDFTYENLLLFFPENKKGTLNNSHIWKVLTGSPENMKILSDISHGFLTTENLMSEGLKQKGKYFRTISLSEDLPLYEPTFPQVSASLQNENSILSLAHANFSYGSIELFQKNLPLLVAQGLNGIEINTRASPAWVQAILHAHEKYELLLTFGSDSHTLDGNDERHGDLGSMYLDPIKDRDFIQKKFNKIFQKLAMNT